MSLNHPGGAREVHLATRLYYNGVGCDKTAKPVLSSSQSDDEPFGWLLNTRLLLVLFVWLIVLTVLFLILCGVMFCRAHRRQSAIYRRPYSFTNPVTSSRPTSFSKWDAMNVRDDGTVDYFAGGMGPGRGNSRQDSRSSQNRSDSGQTSDSTNSLAKKNNNSHAQSNTHM